MAVSLMHHSSATALIRENALTAPHAPAIIFVRDPSMEGGDETWSYGRLDHEARKIAGWLQRRYAPGTRVLLLYPEGPEFAAAFVGCLYASMIAVPSSLPGQYQHQRRRVDSIAEDASVAVVLTCHAASASVGDWAVSQPAQGLRWAVTDGPEFSDSDAEAWRLRGMDQDTLALLQYTSGSTSTPKGVMVSHGNLLHNSEILCRPFGLDRTTRFGSWIPQYHDMGLLAILLPPLLLGGTCVLMTPTTFLKRPHWWLKMVDKYDITWSAAPNFAYDLCARQVTEEQLAELDLSRWRFAANGSEPVQAATLTAFTKRFAPAGFRSDAMAPCYGMAEATVFISGTGQRELAVSHVDDTLLEHHTFRPVPLSSGGRDVVSCGSGQDYDIRIVDPKTREVLQEGRVGEIWLRGQSVAQGYWGRKDATRETFQAVTADGDGGYLRTGDLGTLHNGEVHVTGRLKELIILRGRNIYPQDIEHFLRARRPELVGLFGAAFVVPVQSPGGGVEEQLIVTHEVRGGISQDDLATLTRSMRADLIREYSIRPGAIALVRRGGVLRTTSGKIQRAAMRATFLEGGLETRWLDVNREVGGLIARA
ncbi:fatty acyl-AMP ligase [Streptomyces antimycoticus]